MFHTLFFGVFSFFACLLVYLKECHEDFETSWIVCNLQQSLTKRLRIGISDMTQQQYDGQSSLSLDPISTRKFYRRLLLLLVRRFIVSLFSTPAPSPSLFLSLRCDLICSSFFQRRFLEWFAAREVGYDDVTRKNQLETNCNCSDFLLVSYTDYQGQFCFLH